ncbi:uncharacterized oxidoreductase dhs-27-like [Neocloeon triangulifer]|uniref:uncharacterized oxidoreductase dhs-27-like n=1 Tax=Neocloeon triangulifer TaxID=2078957 RepID=UPI00286F1584|nr:uncharacterized oxidoreductase dhs-27-like [Neocloeon triangulifer]
MDPKSTLGTADIKSALQNFLNTKNDIVFDYEVTRGTEKLQGFLSLIRRAKVTYVDEDGAKGQVTFIVKMPPVSEFQSLYMEGSNFHQRECDYFNVVAPILEKNTRDYPMVKCYLANERGVILEDLSLSGHEIVSKPLTGQNYCSLEYPHIEMIFQALASFHAASAGTDWLKLLPLLNEDGLFEGCGRKMMHARLMNGISFVNEVLKVEFPEAFEKYGSWLSSGAFYEKIIDICRPSKKWQNYLCHGDLWENNVMFKFDEDGKPSGLKMIDLQLVRYSPVSFDLQFFLYLCTDKPFRDANEVPLLATYVEFFNRNLPKSEPELTLKKLLEEYEDFRLFGTLFAATMRPPVFVEGWVAENDGEMNEEVVSAYINGTPAETLMDHFRVDENFRWAVMLIVEELVNELDKVQF